VSVAVAGPRAALLALLLAGHFLADFLFQTRAGVEAKRAGTGYARHGAVVFFAQLLAALPLLSLPLLAALAAIALSHVLVDRLKAALERAGTAPLAAFFLDQGIHVAVVVAAWAVLVGRGGRAIGGGLGGAAGAAAGAGLSAGHGLSAASGLTARGMGAWVTASVAAAVLAFAATGGSAIVEGVLEGLGPEATAGPAERRPRDSGYAGAGRLIGILERTLMLFLVFYGQWAAAVLLLTAKSIARFEDLKDRRFAEYYLVGTLTSLLVATATGLALTKVLGAL